MTDVVSHAHLDATDADAASGPSLITLLLGEKSEEQKQALSRDAELESYLSLLTSYSVERLAREPDALQRSRNDVATKIEDLGFRNYRSFIVSSDCLQGIYKDFSDINGSLGELVTHLPDLGTSCTTFTAAAQSIVTARAANRVTLSQHAQLCDLLEIPQLMDAFVRTGAFEEALELAAFVDGLARKHGSIGLVGAVVAAVKKSSQLMLTQLQQMLCTNIQLPACIRVIGYLRRINKHNERELRTLFLLCRDVWLSAALDAIEDNETTAYLMAYTDASRTHTHDVLTQYRAVFTDTADVSGILQGWIMQRVQVFLATLETHLSNVVDGASLSSLLAQTMHYGMALGRMGVDCRPLIAPVFEAAIVNVYRSQLRTVTEQFADRLKVHKFSAPVSTASSLLSTSADSLAPPPALLDHPPLAVLTNGYLAAFNELRLTAAYSVISAVTAATQASLARLTEILAEHRRSVHLDPAELGLFHAMCTATKDRFLPYIARCLDTVFGSSVPLVDRASIVQALSPLCEPERASTGADSRSASVIAAQAGTGKR